MRSSLISSIRRPGFRVRPLLVFWHRWFGLFAALWLALMAITGSAVVYYEELDSWLNPDLRQVEVITPALPPETWLGAAKAEYPDRFIRFVDLPDAPDKSVRIAMPYVEEGKGDEIEVYVDPYTAKVLGYRAHDVMSLQPRYLMNFLYGLHLDLHLGDAMFWFLGLVAFLWIFDHLVSLVLSFPVLRKWLASFRVRWRSGGHKMTFDLHRAGGLWFFPVTLMFAVSAVYFNWYTFFVSSVNAVSPVTQRAIFTLPTRETPDFGPPVSFADALAEAGAVEGRPGIDMASYNPWKGVYELRAYDPRDIDNYGRRMIVVDGESGSVLSDRHSAEGSAGDVFIAWQYPLHSGKAFGGVGRAIIFVSGIALFMLCVTGILIWWRKFKARAKRRKTLRTLSV
ncbi:MAG: PepSY domain-containing protein [Alphaproteobacteria bacterium]|nr:PepSY domain-containing protein [Alphaproteobacteria bacterium]|tara:strand:- start:429 stop:1616 length:1188 start_codon:yes stop_codon:yes gene_type:complete